MRKVNFNTQDEKEALIFEAENNGEVLAVEANLINENYLIFKNPDEIGNNLLQKSEVEILKEKLQITQIELAGMSRDIQDMTELLLNALGIA